MLFRIVKYFRGLFYVQLVSARTYIHLSITLEREESEPDRVPVGGSRRSPPLFSALSLSRIRPGPPCPPPGRFSFPPVSADSATTSCGVLPCAPKGNTSFRCAQRRHWESRVRKSREFSRACVSARFHLFRKRFREYSLKYRGRVI